MSKELPAACSLWMGHHPHSKAGGQNGGCVPLSVLGSASFPREACSLCFPRACQGVRGVCGGEASGFSYGVWALQPPSLPGFQGWQPRLQVMMTTKGRRKLWPRFES